MLEKEELYSTDTVESMKVGFYGLMYDSENLQNLSLQWADLLKVCIFDDITSNFVIM